MNLSYGFHYAYGRKHAIIVVDAYTLGTMVPLFLSIWQLGT